MKINDIETNLIFGGIVGSTAYGTNIEGSDEDIAGITVPTVDNFFGLSRFEQKDSWGEDELGQVNLYPYLAEHKDVVVYSITKFCNLVLKGNPNILDLLWLEDRFILTRKHYYERIRANRDFLLSKDCYHTYSGYANSQLQRMERHRAWLLKEATGEVTQPPCIEKFLPEGAVKLLDKSELNAFYNFLSTLIKSVISSDKSLEQITSELDIKGLIVQNQLPEATFSYVQEFTRASNDFMSLLNATQAYSSALRDYNAWRSWKTKRNPERAALELKIGYDSKNAMHCIRLQTMAIEILRYGHVYVYREFDADYFKKIRRGEVPYEEVIELSKTLKQDAKQAKEESNLPDRVDKGFLSDLLSDILSDFFKCNKFRAY